MFYFQVSDSLRAMKVLVVLALAVFTGCNANLFYADAPKPQLEVLTDAFWDYVAKATQTADDTVQMIRKSQFGQEVSARLTESADVANQYAVTLQEQLPPAAQDLIAKVTAEADVLKERLTQELSTVRDRLEPYTEDMKAQIQQRVEQLKQELAPYADSLDSEALRTTLLQKSEELKTNLEQSVKDLQTQLGPYTDDLKQKVDLHLQDFKEKVAPMTERVQSELTQRAQQLDEDGYHSPVFTASLALSNGVSVCLTTMKAVAVILALAVITGCNARAVRQADATPNRWEDTVDRFWQYISELNQKADGVVQDLKASQLSRELDTLITDTMAELATYRDDMQAKLSPYTESSTSQMTQDLQLLVNKLQKDMLDAKERSTEYLGELKAMVEQNSNDVHNRISSYTHKLRKRLDKDTEEIRNTVATYLGEIQSRTSQNLETVREHVEPYVQQAGDTATKKLGDISSMLRSQAEGLGHQLETQADGLRTQLESTAQDLRTSLEGKIDELTELLSPYAAQFREQVQNIMDKVKETATA
ncbi:hypothetical protein L3Q82_013396 [Scortum barcoo]|uniref:Uncharacterized protein n=1 Tax=Scortum barcoo TaxID=214431 RepID=A0ACB8W025_9TELE|nr:hypothetical protein L3Q82_013396 [Scortum barcoo]